MRIISLNEVAAKANICRRSLDRMIAKGEGPALVQISTRRKGAIEADADAWLLSRRKPSPAMNANPAK